MSDTPLSLYDYLHTVKQLTDEAFDRPVWFVAEVQAMHSKGGHYYFELAEHQDGQVIAQSRATLWRYLAHQVINTFIKATGLPPQVGSSLLIQGKATFHVQYGFSINITDINPTYTLGKIAQAYQATLDKLNDNGLIHQNKQRPTPFDIAHVCVIAPKDGAGLGDFRAEADTLSAFGVCQFDYHHATFQGKTAPESIRQAIIKARQACHTKTGSDPDLMVIIRGGGATGDLAYLNDYELACLVAEQPMPVWVGIGHERDWGILDEVAHTSFDTPSKVIFGIISHLQSTSRQIRHAFDDITDKSCHQLDKARHQIAIYQRETMTHTHRHLSIKRQLLWRQLHHINTRQKDLISHTKEQIQRHWQTHQDLLPRLHALSDVCRHHQRLILSHHPKQTLKRGYTIIRQDHKVISSVKDLSHQSIDIQFFDGTMTIIPTQPPTLKQP